MNSRRQESPEGAGRPEELAREVAELVMGEAQPELPKNAEALMPMGSVSILHISDGGNWSIGCDVEFNAETRYAKTVPVWRPFPFSTDLSQAMRAVDRYFAAFQPHDDQHYPELFMAYRSTANDSYETSLDGRVATSKALPEAICKLLIALVKGSGHAH